MSVTLNDLVRHHAAGPHQPAAEIAAEVARRGRVLVVLDDDPTGTQSVADLPVLTAWDVDSLAWALQQREPAVYVMTNSRSLAPADAARVNREVVTSALAAARETGVTVGFVSRSDSTLRGHFPLETDTIAETLAELDGPHVDGVVLVPAFGDAGRVTVDAVHHAGNPVDGYTPVGETEFARDATFGYASSDLRDWVAEKSGTTREQSRVVSLGLDLLRQDRAGTVALLRSLTHGQPVVADIVDENDLRLLSAALLEAEAAGSTFLYRVGPPFPRAFIGQEPRTPLTSAEVARIRDGGLAEDATGGLVVVGSHVALTTRQLDALRERTQPVELETVGAEDTAYDVARPVLEAMASTLRRVGDCRPTTRTGPRCAAVSTSSSRTWASSRPPPRARVSPRPSRRRRSSSTCSASPTAWRPPTTRASSGSSPPPASRPPTSRGPEPCPRHTCSAWPPARSRSCSCSSSRPRCRRSSP